MSVAKSKVELVAVHCGHCWQTHRFEPDKANALCPICKKPVCPFCIGLGKACPEWDGSYKDVKK